MKKPFLVLLLPFLAFAQSAPKAWLSVTATNLTVTESASAVLHLQLPPLKKPFENQPPILNQRPPHVEASFLEQDWKPAALVPGDLNAISRNVPRRGDNVRVYTLNKYVSNDIFSSMRDPFAMFGDDPFESLGPRPQRFPFAGIRDDRGNWQFTIALPPFRAKAPGTATFDAVTFTVPTIDQVNARGQVTLKNVVLRTDPVTIRVDEPPAAGRPAAWCGAIGRTFSAAATLDTSVCTVGDPLVLTVTLTGDCDPSTILPPNLSHLLAHPAFRADAASVKTELLPENAGKRFTWRLRAIQAGTLEFPPLAISWYDVAKRAYRIAHTESIPLQAKAGAQATLGAVEEDEPDAFPQPDGIDLDFPSRGTVDFTLRRALALAVRAHAPSDFAAAATAYADYLADAAPATEKPLRARHLTNLAALHFMANNARAALDDYDAAERLVGETPSTRRGIRAAWAKLKNDPRAELPLQRLMLPFWYRHSLPVRLAIAGGILVGLVLLFVVAVKTGSRFAVLFLVLTFAIPEARAQLFNFNFGGGRSAAGDVRNGTLRLEPAHVVVGEPCAFVVTLDVKKGTGVEQLRVSGLPDAANGSIVYGESFEPLTDGSPSAADRVTRRFRLTARFLAPLAGTVNATVTGMAVTRTSTRFGSSSFASNFGARLSALKLDVKPLPSAGRPDGFTGAVGQDFHLVETLTPDHVHPGDLVTATYTLRFNGHFPPDARPRLGAATAAFKSYDLKEKSRTPSEIVWTQMLVPLTTAATNVPAADIAFFDVATRRYATAAAPRPSLVFISAERASTQNTSVTVNAAPEAPKTATGATRADAALDVRFAPSATSPVLYRLPPGAPFTERARREGWRRIESIHGIGWITP